VLLFLLMLGGLVLSTSIPKVFESRGLWFAILYAAVQVGKTVFLWVSTPPSRTLARGLSAADQRLVLWTIALVIEYVSPAARFNRLGDTQSVALST
jgi:low temperature requirement protein LtrA